MAARAVGISKPDVRFDDQDFEGSWSVPVADIKRYMGYLADMYHQIDEMRRWKRKWYDGRAAYVRDNPDRLQGSPADIKKQWSKTVDAQDAAGMEQWAQRQVVAYAAAAAAELARLNDPKVRVPS